MNKYEKITRARHLLELPESATMEQIKSNYRLLLSRWHPDKCTGNPEVCKEMTQKIIEAYQMILVYCNQYEYCFSEEVVNRHLSPEEWWFERFGNDPLWSNQSK
ncbi:MAG: J domain-containing protein [Desulfobacterales bacterium]